MQIWTTCECMYVLYEWHEDVFYALSTEYGTMNEDRIWMQCIFVPKRVLIHMTCWWKCDILMNDMQYMYVP